MFNTQKDIEKLVLAERIANPNARLAFLLNETYVNGSDYKPETLNSAIEDLE